ncbi:MAG: response regulator [Patescibacteria group bacterium]
MRSSPLILVVDDDPGFQEIISSKLKRSSFLVAEAHDGKEAVDKAVNLHPDLILMDINMPGENGTEAVLDLEANPETKDIKIVFLTSQENPWPAAKGGAEGLAKELGARKFINKSEDLDEIASKVKEILNSQ